MIPDMTLRLLKTGLSLRNQGQTALCDCIFNEILTELKDRNQTLEKRLYPRLPASGELSAENRRLEALARAGCWEQLLPALEQHLRREAQACSLLQQIPR